MNINQTSYYWTITPDGPVGGPPIGQPRKNQDDLADDTVESQQQQQPSRREKQASLSPFKKQGEKDAIDFEAFFGRRPIIKHKEESFARARKTVVDSFTSSWDIPVDDDDNNHDKNNNNDASTCSNASVASSLARAVAALDLSSSSSSSSISSSSNNKNYGIAMKSPNKGSRSARATGGDGSDPVTPKRKKNRKKTKKASIGKVDPMEASGEKPSEPAASSQDGDRAKTEEASFEVQIQSPTPGSGTSEKNKEIKSPNFRKLGKKLEKPRISANFDGATPKQKLLLASPLGKAARPLDTPGGVSPTEHSEKMMSPGEQMLSIARAKVKQNLTKSPGKHVVNGEKIEEKAQGPSKQMLVSVGSKIRKSPTKPSPGSGPVTRAGQKYTPRPKTDESPEMRTGRGHGHASPSRGGRSGRGGQGRLPPSSSGYCSPPAKLYHAPSAAMFYSPPPVYRSPPPVGYGYSWNGCSPHVSSPSYSRTGMAYPGPGMAYPVGLYPGSLYYGRHGDPYGEMLDEAQSGGRLGQGRMQHGSLLDLPGVGAPPGLNDSLDDPSLIVPPPGFDAIKRREDGNFSKLSASPGHGSSKCQTPSTKTKTLMMRVKSILHRPKAESKTPAKVQTKQVKASSSPLTLASIDVPLDLALGMCPAEKHKPSLWEDPGVPSFIFTPTQESSVVSDISLSDDGEEGEFPNPLPPCVVLVLKHLETSEEDSCSFLTDSLASLANTTFRPLCAPFCNDDEDEEMYDYPTDYSPVTVGGDDYF